ncbi:MAG TPA: serine hydrolase [Edaphobacter sp.]|nr:serine hydrolase [Edaphobacter sp.]
MTKSLLCGMVAAGLILTPNTRKVCAAQISKVQTVASRDVVDASLQERLAALAATHKGHVTLYAKQLNTGKVVALDPEVPIQTASVIKLAILYEAMEEVREGKAHWDEKITLNKGDGVNGSGVLMFFDTPLTLTLKDVLTMMVIVSDNTATNLAIDRFGVGAVNARIAWMGLKDTHLYKKIGKPATEPMPADQPKFGLGKTTAHEMEMIMERIGRCELGQPGEPARPGDMEICQTALTMLRNQFYRNTIPRYLEKLDSTEEGSGIASKTGSLNAVRNDVAIVAGKSGPIVISIFTDRNEDQSWTADNEAEIMIAKLAKQIVEAWSPEGIDGRNLVPGLGLGAGLAAGTSK